MDENRRKQLDGIVSQMEKNGEKPENIQMVVNDFKSKYSTNKGRMATGVSGNGEVNWLGKLIFPRGAEVQHKQLVGDNVSTDERVGVAGEAINKIGAPIAALLGLPFSTVEGIGGAIEGATQPGASTQQRATNAVVQGVLQYGGAKAGEIVASKTLKPAGNLLANPTKSVAGKNVAKAAQKATDEGVKIAWDKGENNLMDQIVGEIKKKMVWNNEVRDATNNLVSNLTKVPETVTGQNGLPMIGNSTFNPTELLQTRSQVTRTVGDKIFNALQGKSGGVEDKVYSIARNVISKNLHKLAPETLGPDAALKIYNTFGPLGKFGLPGIIGEAVAGKYAAGKVADLLRVLGAGGH